MTKGQRSSFFGGGGLLFEFRASHLQRRNATTSIHFALVILEIVSLKLLA
jgi:hypothetical protein